MAFSTATLTHKYVNADQSPGSGEVVFTLLGPMTNAGVTIVPAHVTTTVQADGSISQTLTSTIDSGTNPGNVYWRVDERIQGASMESYEIQVPSGGVSVDLGTLKPFVTPPEWA